MSIITNTIIGMVLALIATQEAFKKYQAINSIPFSQLAMNLLAIMAGIFVFQQVISFPLLFWTGVFLIMGGATLLARYLADSPQKDE